MALALLIVLLVACGAPGTSPPPQNGNGDGNGGNGDLATALNALGADTTTTARVDPQGDPLPEDYAPLGGSASIGVPDALAGASGSATIHELFIAGPTVTASGSRITLLELDDVLIDGDGTVQQGTASPLLTLNEVDHPWVDDDSGDGAQSNNGRSLRAAASGDLDGDGLDEIVVVYVDTALAARPVRVLTIDDSEDGFGEMASNVADGSEVLDVQVATGDFTGDGVASVVLALADATGVDLLFLEGEPGSYSVDTSLTKRIAATTDVDQITARLAAGNLDYDNALELVVVVNELITTTGSVTGSARYFVFDDASTGFDELASGAVSAVGFAAAHVADVALGDITGNGLDEIVLGGLTSFNTECSDQPEAVVMALDNAIGGFEPLGATVVDAGFADCAAVAFAPVQHRFFHVTTPDLDGDGVSAIQAGRYVFASFRDEATFTLMHEIPEAVFWQRDATNAHITTNTSAIVAADVTSDGRENIVMYHQWNPGVRVWGLSTETSVGVDGFAELSRVPTAEYTPVDDVRPLLVPANVDHDSVVMAYAAASHELVFTEPMLIAVMAAAPCGEGIGQNLDGCSATFGNADVTTVTAETTVSVSASAYIGAKTAVNVPWLGEFGAQKTRSLTVRASASAGASYSVGTSRRFTSGPLEDAVVFSTIPYDRYVYDVLSHPDPDMIGGTIEVMVPREPIVMKVEREFYNERISDVSTPIGSNVFDHVAGDLSTYPGVSRKNELLGQFGGPLGLGGLQNGPLSVGEGSGSTGLGIDVGAEVSAGTSLGIEYTRSVDVTAGPVLAGYSVGYGVDASLTVSSGESTSYDVSVGDLSSATFAEHQYAFGMFTYVQPIGGQQAKVINFWVE
ncbi:MAG: hypothetical protein EA416_00100 [Trueperaceae bacterium]|nr:MAG: hypothetical protein EA416_00100 [Trueperaceae bacterium]